MAYEGCFANQHVVANLQMTLPTKVPLMPWSCKSVCEIQAGEQVRASFAASQLVSNANVCSFLPLVLIVPGCGKSTLPVSLCMH